MEFYEWIDESENLSRNIRHGKKDIFNIFVDEYQDFKKWLQVKTFVKWIEKYCKYKGFEYLEGNSNGQRWFEIKTEDNENEYDTPF
jgi:hypothetical protein